MTYAEMVSSLKKNLKEEEALMKDIESVRETREGHLLVEVKKGSTNMANLLEKIKTTSHMETVHRLNGAAAKKAVNLYGINIDMKEEEIGKRIQEILGKPENDQEIEVRALRQMRGGRQAATILAFPQTIGKLIQIWNIKLGFSSALVRERDDKIRCNRCWEEGHFAKDCRGEDRAKKCRNCTSEGHLVRECTEKPHCLVCNRTGHRTFSGQCKGKTKAIRKEEEGKVVRRSQSPPPGTTEGQRDEMQL
ncbi:uncharacterized protein LOC123313246 [Coccinella septempunctata]|uniref:uncharacterized protein LOC123313246 n=1 Tax=Coccinella septempunctata TaxID=41139 RepID=UPI001D077AFC|nr:uncharacterized protein LOC123313246 [Coccinella septempunctata]